MKLKVMFPVALCALGLTASAWAQSAQPAVQVDVVDGEGDEFFAPPEPEVQPPAPDKPAPAAREGVKGRADTLFEALEDEEAGRASASPQMPASSAAPAGQTANSAGQPAAATPNTNPAPAQRVQAQPARSWWDRPSHASQGDLLFWISAGSFDAGGFGGLGGEIMATDMIGIRMSGWLGGFGHQDPGSGMSSNWNFFEGGTWAIQRDVNPTTAKGGMAHLTELSVAAHLLPKQMLDVYTTLGLSHFGYEVDYRDGTERGGAAYTRVGAGANLHVSRFFGGFDFGWYPVELFRYDLQRVRRDDYEADLVPVTNRVEARRFTLTAQVGLRF